MLRAGALVLAAREPADSEQQDRKACDEHELQLRPTRDHFRTGAMTYSPNFVRTTIVDPRVYRGTGSCSASKYGLRALCDEGAGARLAGESHSRRSLEREEAVAGG
ncbi:MAG TPA: hypothetical protein VFB62_12655, partial [Polyangiaceae bacterium]|nr:hypothetical protein [Polyangiaceae bacterium]